MSNKQLKTYAITDGKTVITTEAQTKILAVSEFHTLGYVVTALHVALVFDLKER